MATVKIGDKVDGKVSRLVKRVGVVFEISGSREALMPMEHYGEKLPRLHLADEVADLHILDVDPAAQGCAQIILSGEFAKVPSRCEAPLDQMFTPAPSPNIKERPTSSAKRSHKMPMRQTSPRVADRVNGRVVKVINRVGIVFDIGARCEAIMLHEDFGRKLPRLRPGDQVADLIVLDVDDEQEDAGRQILLGGEEVYKLMPNSKKLSSEKPHSPSRSPAPPSPATLRDLESPSPQEVEPPDSDRSDSICELSVLAGEEEAEVSESDWSDSICELSADVVMPSMQSVQARVAGSMRNDVNVHSCNGTPSTSSTGSHSIVDRRLSESRLTDMQVHGALYKNKTSVAFPRPPQTPQPHHVPPPSQAYAEQEERRIRRRARAVPFSRLPQETCSESTHMAAVSSRPSRKSCGQSDRNHRSIFYVDAGAGEQGPPVSCQAPPRGTRNSTDALHQDRLDLSMRAPRGRQRHRRVWHAHGGQSRSASRRPSRSASPSKDTVITGRSKVADESAIQALMSSILNTAQEIGVSCDQLSPVLSTLHDLKSNLRIHGNFEAPRKNVAGLHHRKTHLQTDTVYWQPEADASDSSLLSSDNECSEGFTTAIASQTQRLRRIRQSAASEPGAAGRARGGKPLELPPGSTRHRDRRSLAQLQRELARLQRCLLPLALSSEAEASELEAPRHRQASRRAPGPQHLRCWRRDHEESDEIARVLDDCPRKPPRRSLDSLLVGEQVWGIVVSVLPSLGIWFDIGVEKDAMLPKRHFGLSSKMFGVGDTVCGLVVVCLDLVKNQITLSAEGLKFGASKSKMSRSGGRG